MTKRSRVTGLVATVCGVSVALGACSAGGSADGSSEFEGTGAYQPGPYVEDVPVPGPTRATPAMTDPAQDALSTFALDVDTGSYTRFRDAVRQGYGVDASGVRTEEFVNYFAQDYEPPADGLGVSIDATALPFRTDHRLVRVGITSAPASAVSRADADLVLVVDCSGSMDEAGKMETTRYALRTLVSSLRRTDRVAMVCYSTQADVYLEPTPVAEREAVLAAIDRLEPRDSTNAAAGLALGYDLAAKMRAEGRLTRVVLVSDGVANVGETDPEGILARISTQAKAGINLISVGVGITTYNDRLLEQLADQGDGWHVYVDGEAEAERVFGSGLTGSLVVAGTDARAQVEFDPAQVAGYRLLGYENRAVADEDFRNDAVDGGEVFAGHSTTALYEVEMREGAGDGPFVRATVRYLDDDGRPVERDASLTRDDCASSPREASPRLRQDLVVALLTDHLTDGPWSQEIAPADLRAEARTLPAVLDGDPDVHELVDLVERATT